MAMYVPIGHVVHDATPTEAVLLYVPAAQSLHEAELARDVFPDTHDVQVFAAPAE